MYDTHNMLARKQSRIFCQRLIPSHDSKTLTERSKQYSGSRYSLKYLLTFLCSDPREM